MRSSNTGIFAAFGGCGVVGVLILVLNVVLGGLATQYVLAMGLGIAAPFFACALAGLFLGQFTIPLAIVLWLLSFGVTMPLFNLG